MKVDWQKLTTKYGPSRKPARVSPERREGAAKSGTSKPPKSKANGHEDLHEGCDDADLLDGGPRYDPREREIKALEYERRRWRAYSDAQDARVRSAIVKHLPFRHYIDRLEAIRDATVVPSGLGWDCDYDLAELAIRTRCEAIPDARTRYLVVEYTVEWARRLHRLRAGNSRSDAAEDDFYFAPRDSRPRTTIDELMEALKLT